MITFNREANTDYLFAGLLEKEMINHPTDINLTINIDPCISANDIYYSQDTTLKGDKVEHEFVFFIEPSWREHFQGKYKNKCALVTYAADPLIHKPYNLEKDYDIGFIGNINGDDRIEYLNALKSSGLKCYISSNIPGNIMASELSRCKLLFNHIRFVDINLRFFETMAIGCQLVNRKSSLKEFAEENIHYFGYDNPTEMLLIVKRLLKDDDLRNRTSLRARSHFLSNHTYAHRSQSIINHLTEIYV